MISGRVYGGGGQVGALTWKENGGWYLMPVLSWILTCMHETEMKTGFVSRCAKLSPTCTVSYISERNGIIPHWLNYYVSMKVTFITCLSLIYVIKVRIHMYMYMHNK